MAAVYLARAEGPGGFERLCALKMIHENLSEEREFVDLFLNEARIAARLHHPNVIGVHDIDTFEGRYYLRMDYVSGETLWQALDATWNEGITFPLGIAAQVVSSVAEGLHMAHELADADGQPIGVIHRDVGPHNILIGYDGLVRVMDFGIAKAMDRVSGTQPGTWRGTLPFMSPEHVRGEPMDRRADLFSLGVVLWEATVGTRLFKHKTVAGTMARVLGMDVPRPSTLRKDYPEELDRIVMKALERDRERRYQTAKEMSDDLRAFLHGRGDQMSPKRIEEFMKALFPDRYAQRLALEREATLDEPPPELTKLPKIERSRIRSLEAKDSDLLGDPEIARVVREATAVYGPLDEPAPTERAPLPSLGVAAAPDLAERREPVTEVLPTSSPGAKAADALVDETDPPPHHLPIGTLENEAPTAELGARPVGASTSSPGLPPSASSPGGRLPPSSASSAASLPPIPKPSTRADLRPVTRPGGWWFRYAAALVVAAALGSVWLILSFEPEAETAPVPGQVMVTLTFNVDPPEAAIFVDGTAQKGDLVVPLSAQQYRVQASAKGFLPKSMVVSAEASRSIAIKLDKEPKRRKRRRRPRRRRSRRKR